MNRELGFSEAVYGFGASIFFIGYFIFEVPSNLILQRVGASLWIARIMITWGIIAAAMMFVRGKGSFYLLRFLLGAAEAGFFPGILLYFTYWVPASHRAHVGMVFYVFGFGGNDRRTDCGNTDESSLPSDLPDGGGCSFWKEFQPS